MRSPSSAHNENAKGALCAGSTTLLSIAARVTYRAEFLRNARQPPEDEISFAPASACGSQRNPFTQLPSSNSIDPIPSGGGIAATKLPNPSAGSPQTSNSIAAPDSPALTLSNPGLAGGVFASAKKR